MRELNKVILDSRRDIVRATEPSFDRRRFTLTASTFYAGCAALGVSVIASLALGAVVLVSDDLSLEADSRHATMVTQYEARLARLRTQMQTAESARLVEQERLRQRIATLTARQVKLGVEETMTTGSLRLSEEDRSIPRAGDMRSTLQDMERSLESAEARQLADLERLRGDAFDKATQFAKVLRRYGLKVPMPDSATGGPLIELKGSDPFEERMAALEGALSQLDRVRQMAERLPRGNPVPGRSISSRFGTRRDPINGRTAMHGGLDFKAPRGEPVLATGAGRVTRAGKWGGYGKIVEIDHGGGIVTRYAHLSRINVRKGETVPRGKVIGKVGSTGRSTGPHLHYEVRRGKQTRDPMHYVRLERRLASLF